MSVVRAVPFARHRLLAGLISIGVLAIAIDHAVAFPLAQGGGATTAPLVEATGHLVVSEVMTGGASASDEFVELYNPSSTMLPLEGLELVYVTASGATVTRKASWAAGAPGIPRGAHLLLANSAGIFAGLADVAYANGLAATGGSVALRVIGAATAIDAVGWGSATSTWLETRPAPAPAAGSSLERLPGASLGSGQDTNDNLIDFVIQSAPDPQNSGSPPIPVPSDSPVQTGSPAPSGSAEPSASQTTEPSVEPSLTGTPAASATATPSATVTPRPTATPAPTATPTPTPSPTAAPLSIGDARSQADGTTVTVEGVTLTASDFTDGGGYLVDATGGIAVLVSDGTFGRGQRLRVTGTIDDRYAQRTIRATADAITNMGVGSEPLAADTPTGSIGEGTEGRLVEVSGLIISSVTTLSTGLAWDLDDGSGAIRILVGTATAIDTSTWVRGVGLRLIGVVGQRDSSGTGTSGFRIQPRETADLLTVEPIATPSPTPTPQPTATPTPSGSPSPSATPTPGSRLVSIADARAATAGTHLRIRGVVTAPSGLIDTGSAVVQDATAGILVRLGTDVGSLSLGQLVELDGTRATKTGMLSLRVATPPVQLGTQAEPEPMRRATGALGESQEARLVIVRGSISTAISRPRGGNVSFAIDDGSGPIRVTISSRSGISDGSLTRGAWLELRAVLAQETTGSAPSSGYRLWPRVASDLRVIAAPVAGSTQSAPCCASVQTNDYPLPDSAVADALLGQAAGPPGQEVTPVLARPQPTSSPRPTSSTGQEAKAASDQRAPAGGLVVAGMGLGTLAGLLAWFGRRRAPDDDDEPGSIDAEGGPRLSVLRAEGNDARNERGILPPT
ncbi:MAG TPA: lamin tail domain-containing protein [Candidatus Limnocylindria bacterium]